MVCDLRHTSLISGHEPPNYSQDTMLSGVFRSFAHDHYFSSQTDEATEMRDHLTFSISPFLWEEFQKGCLPNGASSTS